MNKEDSQQAENFFLSEEQYREEFDDDGIPMPNPNPKPERYDLFGALGSILKP